MTQTTLKQGIVKLLRSASGPTQENVASVLYELADRVEDLEAETARLQAEVERLTNGRR